jgi:short-subunit dehydrogenase
MKRYESKLSEEGVDVQKIISDLIDTDFGGSNEEQGKALSLMRGLAFSDDSAANKFMKKLSDVTSTWKKEDFK